MSEINVTRTDVTVPAAGEALQVNISGRRIIIEEAPESDPVTVPTIHFGSAEGDGIPAIRRAAFADTNGWSSFYVRGNDISLEGQALSLIILQSVTSLLELPET